MIHLLDVNVLIALSDPRHVAHDDAHDWFAAIDHAAWATCPITENGVIRIVANPKYRTRLDCHRLSPRSSGNCDRSPATASGPMT